MSRTGDEQGFERDLRDSLHGLDSRALPGSVLAAIAGRSPREMNAARTVQAFRGVSGVAGIVLAVLLTLVWAGGAADPVATDVARDVAVTSSEESALIYLEETLSEETSESSVLAAVFLEGMSP